MIVVMASSSSAIHSVVSTSLLRSIDKVTATFDWFCVPQNMLILDDCMICEWLDDDDWTRSSLGKENSGAVSHERLVPFSSAPLMSSSRFNAVTSPEELATLSKGFAPPNTTANNDWAVRNFLDWATWRRSAHTDDPVPLGILSCADATCLNKWLSLYVIETRRKDGQSYPTATLNTLILCGLKRHMTKVNPLMRVIHDLLV